MKNWRLKIFMICAGIALLSSCKKSLDDLFLNPDAFTSAPIELLFPQGIVNAVPNGYSDGYNRTMAKLGPMMQLTINNGSDPGTQQLYEFSAAASAGNGGLIDFGRWADYYNNKMPQLKEIEKIYDWQLSDDEKEGYKVYYEMSKIIEAFNTSVTTDLFGDMPYVEAFTARNSIYKQPVILQPKFDTQESIYSSLLNDLKSAASYLETFKSEPNIYPPHSTLGTQDILYKGDMTKWVKLANSLRLRLAMRISAADQSRATQEIKDIIDNNEPLILSNADNAVLYDQSLSDQYLFRAVRDFGSTGTFASAFMVNTINSSNDPRKKILLYSADANNGDYKGVPVSYGDRDRSNLTYNSAFAHINPLFFGYNYGMPVGFIIDAASVNFLLAEAAKKGFISGGDTKAAEYYDNGIVNSVLAYYKYYSTAPASVTIGSGSTAVTINKDASLNTAPSEADLRSWITTSTYAYSAGNAIQQIALQKWMHTNILQIDETFAEFRRLKLPALPADIFNGQQLNTKYPLRVPYPNATAEFASNKENFNAAVAATNDNSYLFPVWWNK